MKKAQNQPSLQQ